MKIREKYYVKRLKKILAFPFYYIFHNMIHLYWWYTAGRSSSVAQLNVFLLLISFIPSTWGRPAMSIIYGFAGNFAFDILNSRCHSSISSTICQHTYYTCRQMHANFILFIILIFHSISISVEYERNFLVFNETVWWLPKLI